MTAAAALLVSGPVPAWAQTDPIEQADEAVAAARAEADAAAGAYFELLTRSETLETEIQANEEQLADLKAESKRLRRLLRERAALAYVRAGSTSVEFGLDRDDELLEAARRATMLDRLNDNDNDLATRVTVLREAVETKRARLEADRAAFDETLVLLREEQEQLDAKLATAQARRNAVIAETIAAEQAAAAAAASTTTTTTTPTAGTEAAEPPSTPAPTSSPPAAPTPPASYAPTPGEHPQHWHPFLTCTRAIESGGNYQAYNASGPYYGAYQFLQSTWNSAANHAGRGELIGLKPSNASPYDQDDMA
ncbi:MAG TPA: hypothetical protein VF152_07045, partial [Acidimicrobiia bacterium]